MKKIILLSLTLILITHLLHSQPYYQRITTGNIATDAGSYTMAAWGDYNNDGFQDLAVVPWNDGCWSCSSPLMMYSNNGNSTFTQGNYFLTDVTLSCNGITFGDYNNDGRLDFFFTQYFNKPNYLFRNDVAGFYRVMAGTIATELASSTGCSWADYDRDGWIDIFISNGQNQNNSLFKNNGNGTFTKITSGAIVNDGGNSRSCAWGDYNNDGWPDLFVNNYQGQNCFLYKNNGNGTFTKITNVAPVMHVGWGSGCSWADYDNDGWLDLLVTYNSEPNRLYHNERNGTFTLTNLAPSQETGQSFYPAWGDIDNDGFIDLFVPKRSGSFNALYKNNGGTSFTKITNDIVALEGGACDAGAFADYNNDGKLDLFVTSGSTPNPTFNYLYKNVNNSGNNYIVFKLDGCVVNRSAIGAKVTIVTGSTRQIRVVQGGNGSQSMLWPHFGLGNISIIDTVKIDWTTGITKILTNVAANQFLYVTECPVGIINNELPETYELRQNYPNPFNPSTQIEYSIMKAANVKITVYDISGRVVRTLVNEKHTFGTYTIDFDGKDLATGIYIYKIETEEFSSVKKMMLIK